MEKTAILNGRKMVLPHYGKYNGVYGYFTSEGFIYAFMDDNEGVVRQEFESIEYDKISVPTLISSLPIAFVEWCQKNKWKKPNEELDLWVCLYVEGKNTPTSKTGKELFELFLIDNK